VRTVTIRQSAKYADTLDLTCKCGWFCAVGKYTYNTNSMKVVKQEATYLKQDHINDCKGGK